MKLLDCTLRDGGYYNDWDFDNHLIQEYLKAMEASGVDIVELGFRSTMNNGFKGSCAYTSDEFLNSLPLAGSSLTIGVMVNAGELLKEPGCDAVLERLFPLAADESPVGLVRIACHVYEFSAALAAVEWLTRRGYQVGFNLMQIADRSEDEVKAIARESAQYPLAALYFADSMGSMGPDQVAQIIHWLRSEWKGDIGIHTHDNMGLALSNTLRALDEGATWVDSTVTGMGRGPGNARTEELAIEMAERRGQNISFVPLVKLVREHFKPMQSQYGWGTNPYFYLAGKYGIHPTYIQQMLYDPRYNEEDILAAIEHLRCKDSKKFNITNLEDSRQFYVGKPTGRWNPADLLDDRDVLILGAGPSVKRHRQALESYIERQQPLVLALNTQTSLRNNLIDLRVACHPVRLLADRNTHAKLPQPLIVPFSMLPDDVSTALQSKAVLDFGLNVQPGKFAFHTSYATTPNSLVIAYALAIANSGNARRILLAGFDGYSGDDPRSQEMMALLDYYHRTEDALPLVSVTPTRYGLHTESIYAL